MADLNETGRPVTDPSCCSICYMACYCKAHEVGPETCKCTCHYWKWAEEAQADRTFEFRKIVFHIGFLSGAIALVISGLTVLFTRGLGLDGGHPALSYGRFLMYISSVIVGTAFLGLVVAACRWCQFGILVMAYFSAIIVAGVVYLMVVGCAMIMQPENPWEGIPWAIGLGIWGGISVGGVLMGVVIIECRKHWQQARLQAVRDIGQHQQMDTPNTSASVLV